MQVRLFQLDGKIPNLALMRLAAHHRSLGDEVQLEHIANSSGIERNLYDASPECVYASAIFERTRPLCRRLLEIYPAAIIGGTGWDRRRSLEDFGITSTRQDYSDYPKWRQSIGFTQRGCRLECSFCVVPEKEGKVRPVATIADIWRGEPWPREILLLDNDFFGQACWRERIAEMREGQFKVSFNQGINCRMISEEAAVAIASVDYRADDMKRPMLYTAWDSREDEGVLFRGLNRLQVAGVSPDHITVYMLIGYWAGETDTDWLYRQQRLRDFGARPFPMPFVRNALTRGFQRWCVRRDDLKCSWDVFKAANCRPEKVGRGRLALPLFDGESL